MSRWSTEDERRIAYALSDARGKLLRLTGSANGPDIVFETMKEAIDIWRRLSVSVGPKRLRAMLIAYLPENESERAEALKQRMIDISAGDDPNEVLGIFNVPMPNEVSMMETVNRVFRECVIGKTQEIKDRDWWILNALAGGPVPKAILVKDVPGASGYGILRNVAGMFGLKNASLAQRKAMQCAAIWGAVKHLLPQLASAPAGTVWQNVA